MQRYQVTVRHEGLNKIRVIAGTDRWSVEERGRVQAAAWDAAWERQVEKGEKAEKAEQRRLNQFEKKQSAQKRTAAAEEAIEECHQLLSEGLKRSAAIDWASLKLTTPFSIPKPVAEPHVNHPPEPKPTDSAFKPQIGVLAWIFPPLRRKAEERASAQYAQEHAAWVSKRDAADDANVAAEKEHENATIEWEKKRREFEAQQLSANSEIDEARQKYQAGETQAVVDYFDMVLGNSRYPDFFPDEWTVAFGADNKILVVDYWLPAPVDLPNLKEVKYVVSRDSLDEVKLKESVTKKLYDDISYQVCLRTLHEIFSSDLAKTVAASVFNGWVNYLNPATGTETKACIMSVQVSREEFDKLDLTKVEPKACFRALKGVGSSQLNAVAPIQPVLQLNKEDPRFVSSIDVAAKLDEGVNLAAIGWEEFEHLIRGIFEREFSNDGGEVKVTQASHDGGVDAIAFDPDPIRGGKIVIQAKRYTNTVGVAAVRDLYGTVMNEGAIKGILVTTSNYGPDAYAFAKGKPITLMDGGNLLFLLSKQGQKAHINLREAKQLGGSMQRFSLLETQP